MRLRLVLGRASRLLCHYLDELAMDVMPPVALEARRRAGVGMVSPQVLPRLAPGVLDQAGLRDLSVVLTPRCVSSRECLGHHEVLPGPWYEVGLKVVPILVHVRSQDPGRLRRPRDQVWETFIDPFSVCALMLVGGPDLLPAPTRDYMYVLLGGLSLLLALALGYMYVSLVG